MTSNDPKVTVCVLTKNCESTIGQTLNELIQSKKFFQICLIDGGSTDNTLQIAKLYPVEIYHGQTLIPNLGKLLGKGDQMYRGQSIYKGDIIVFQDGDLINYTAKYATGLADHLIKHPNIQFVKGSFSRHFTDNGVTLQNEGGRVSTLTAKPLLKILFPALSFFTQPLSGQVAIRTKALNQIPMTTGYGVEVGMLIDIYKLFGIESMAELFLGELWNTHQQLSALEGMANVVSQTVLSKLNYCESPIERTAYSA